MSTSNNLIESTTLKLFKKSWFSSSKMKRKEFSVLRPSAIISVARISLRDSIRGRDSSLKSIISIETLRKGWERTVGLGTRNQDSDRRRRWLCEESTERISHLCLGQKYLSLLPFFTSCKAESKRRTTSGNSNPSTMKMIRQASDYRKKKGLKTKTKSFKKIRKIICSLRKGANKRRNYGSILWSPSSELAPTKNSWLSVRSKLALKEPRLRVKSKDMACHCAYPSGTITTKKPISSSITTLRYLYIYIVTLLPIEWMGQRKWGQSNHILRLKEN